MAEYQANCNICQTPFPDEDARICANCGARRLKAASPSAAASPQRTFSAAGKPPSVAIGGLLVLLLIPLFFFGSVTPCGIVTSRLRAEVKGKAQLLSDYEREHGDLVKNLTNMQCMSVAAKGSIFDYFATLTQRIGDEGVPADTATMARAPEPAPAYSDYAAYQKAMMSDLRNLQSQQEVYYSNPANNYTYAGRIYDLNDFATSQGVSVEISASGQTGWGAQAHHSSLPSNAVCAIYAGTVSTISYPAVTSGVVSCSQ